MCYGTEQFDAIKTPGFKPIDFECQVDNTLQVLHFVSKKTKCFSII